MSALRVTLACVSFVHAPAFAQVAPATASVSPAPAKETVIELSPFSVTAERDVGFVAASALSGGRLATDLKDTPVAYSVITRDFIDALGLVDVEEAMTWQVGAYAPQSDVTNYKLFNGEAGSAIISRGIQTGEMQRNFFLLRMNSDTYSQERIDSARGPNALLFGTSGLGGQVISMTKRARTDKPFTRLTFLAGSWDKYRSTLDVNQPVNAKLALRMNLLWQDSKNWRDMIFDDRRGAHLTATFNPFRRTQIRAEFEYYKQNSMAGRETTTDRVSGWDGSTTVAAPIDTIASSDAKGIARNGSSVAPYLVYIPGSDDGTIMNWANTWKTQGGGANAAVPVGGALALSTTNLGTNNGPILENVFNQDSLFRLAETGSFFRRPTRETVISPDFPTLRYGFKDVAVFVEHQQGEHLFFEAAFNYADTLKISEYISARTLSEVTIDVNATLPNGLANPNFKQAYGDSSSAHVHFQNNMAEARAAAALVFNGTRWGDFSGGLMIGGRSHKQYTTQFTEVLNRSADIRIRSRDDSFIYRYYWNDPNKPFTIPGGVSLVDPIARTTTSYEVATVVDLKSPANQRSFDTTFGYLQGSLKASLFKGRVNLVAGGRHDEFELTSYSMNPSINAAISDLPTNWDGRAVYSRPLPPGDYWSLTYKDKNAGGAVTGTGATLPALTRPRDATGRPLAQYASDRFQDDYSSPPVKFGINTATYGSVVHVLPWFSVYANFAESFNAPTAGLTLTGATVPPGMSEGWDAGLRFSLLQGRFSATIGRYGSTLINQTITSSQGGNMAAITAANRVGDLSADGYNTRGLALIPPQLFDFQDRRARGYEIDIVANLTPSWRLTANAGIPKVLTTNANQNAWAYLAANEATLRQIVLDAGALIDANGLATVDLGVPVGNRSPDVASALTAWNNIRNFKATSSPTRETFSDLPNFTANFYTDYRFTRGPLKNLRIGSGVQYIARKAIGNRGGDTIVNPANPATAIDDPSVDAETRIYMPAHYTMRANVSYKYNLTKRVALDLTLSVSNLLDRSDPIFIAGGLRPPGGDIRRPDRVTVPVTFLHRQPRSYTLTGAFNF